MQILVLIKTQNILGGNRSETGSEMTAVFLKHILYTTELDAN